VRGLDGTQYAIALEAAVHRSVLEAFPPRARDAICALIRRVDFPSKTYFRSPGQPERIGLVVDGLGRSTYITAEGHELTISWAHAGDWLSTFAFFGGDSGVSLHAVTPLVWADLNVPEFFRLLRSDPDGSQAVMAVLEDTVRRAIEEEAVLAYGDLRTRTRRRLLEIACRHPGEKLLARVTQEQLATSVGATRQSVARVLAELRRGGAIRSASGGIEIVSARALVPQSRDRLPVAC
jgi:CRP/FNR family cyclic AMP-dependent transcriptional regulator